MFKIHQYTNPCKIPPQWTSPLSIDYIPDFLLYWPPVTACSWFITQIGLSEQFSIHHPIY